MPSATARSLVDAQFRLQLVRSAIILASVDGQLSGFGIMSRTMVSQRLQGAMDVCNVEPNNTQRKTSMLSWSVNTPACVPASSK